MEITKSKLVLVAFPPPDVMVGDSSDTALTNGSGDIRIKPRNIDNPMMFDL